MEVDFQLAICLDWYGTRARVFIGPVIERLPHRGQRRPDRTTDDLMRNADSAMTVDSRGAG
jgi:hypothetical protein